jgi:hypothetical protein
MNQLPQNSQIKPPSYFAESRRGREAVTVYQLPFQI